ncbi:MAG: helix-turn-helix transcriptional regulator, partial [Prevotella sp.]|nr:helix-turn-helix transcriptional regulator [Prevotella sp.]
DTFTFLAVVNFTINGYRSFNDAERLSVPTLMQYLRASHAYYLDFQLPFIRKELVEALDENDNLARLILKLYDEYAHSIRSHMKYEEKMLFPYVEGLLDGKANENYDIETFSKHHNQVDHKVKELKSIIIKYLPSDGLRNNQLSATLYDIYNNEEWLKQHSMVEDEIFIPAIRLLERKLKQSDVTYKISNMINQNPSSTETLSDREKDVIVSLVQGMTNKEIADHLFISINTVITHRRNIARKLQIHSPAGLTIYAIVNNLVDISSVKL